MNTFMNGGLQSPAVATLLFSAIAALLAILVAGQPVSARKTGAVALPLALLAILVVIEKGYVLLGGALLVSSFGEMLLVQDRLSAYVTGLGVMLAARVVYVVLFALGSHPAILVGEAWRGVVVALIIIAGIWFVRRIFYHAGPLRWPAVIFGFCDMLMCAAAAALHPISILAGVVVLVAADVETAFDRFLRPSDKETPVAGVRLTWFGRYLGQGLIVLTALRVI